MDGPIVPVPDGISPLLGYRLWRVIEEGGDLVLCPLSFESRDWVGATWGWVSSTCSGVSEIWVSLEGELEWPDPHRAPDEACTCGFYAMKELTPELLFGASLSHPARGVPGSEGRFVLGRVELAGKVVEHELGYRAERARIVELIPIRGAEPEIQAIATRVGVGVARSVIVPRTSGLREQLDPARRAWAATKSPPPSWDGGLLPAIFMVIGVLALFASFATANSGPWSTGSRLVWFACLALYVTLRDHRDPTRSKGS